MSNLYKYQPETLKLSERLYKLGPNTVASKEQQTGIVNHEPLIVILDSCLRYAKAHQARWESPVSEDYVLGPAFEQVLDGVRILLDGVGSVCAEGNSNYDSKDNGVCSSILQECLKTGGFFDL